MSEHSNDKVSGEVLLLGQPVGAWQQWQFPEGDDKHVPGYALHLVGSQKQQEEVLSVLQRLSTANGRSTTLPYYASDGRGDFAVGVCKSDFEECVLPAIYRHQGVVPMPGNVIGSHPSLPEDALRAKIRSILFDEGHTAWYDMFDSPYMIRTIDMHKLEKEKYPVTRGKVQELARDEMFRATGSNNLRLEMGRFNDIYASFPKSEFQSLKQKLGENDAGSLRTNVEHTESWLKRVEIRKQLQSLDR